MSFIDSIGGSNHVNNVGSNHNPERIEKQPDQDTTGLLAFEKNDKFEQQDTSAALACQGGGWMC